MTLHFSLDTGLIQRMDFVCSSLPSFYAAGVFTTLPCLGWWLYLAHIYFNFWGEKCHLEHEHSSLFTLNLTRRFRSLRLWTVNEVVFFNGFFCREIIFREGKKESANNSRCGLKKPPNFRPSFFRYSSNHSLTSSSSFRRQRLISARLSSSGDNLESSGSGRRPTNLLDS